MKTTVILLFKILLILAALYAVVVIFFYFSQDRLLYPATREIWRTPAAWGWDYEDLALPVDGETTRGWYVPLENARGVVLFSHGNAGNIAHRLESIELLRSFGLSVLVYDYGGYGESSGRPSEQRTKADVQAMWDWLTQEKGHAPEEILLFGRSLGGAVTMQLAPEVQPGAVILESTFKSVPDIVYDYWPWLPARRLIRHVYPSMDRIGEITAPLLLIHSPEDDIVPYSHGLALYDAAPEPKTFGEIQGDHNQGFVDSMDVYRQYWETFLTPIFGPWEGRHDQVSMD